jgi:hypothetical protein
MTTSTHADALRGMDFLYFVVSAERRDFAGAGVECFADLAGAV